MLEMQSQVSTGPVMPKKGERQHTAPHSFWAHAVSTTESLGCDHGAQQLASQFPKTEPNDQYISSGVGGH